MVGLLPPTALASAPEEDVQSWHDLAECGETIAEAETLEWIILLQEEATESQSQAFHIVFLHCTISSVPLSFRSVLIQDAFGVERGIQENDLNPFRFCGEYYDRETGNIYLRARFYDPSIGRFTTQDTHWNTRNMVYGDKEYKPGEIRFPDNNAITQSGNLYAYCMNNPVIYSDEDGEVAVIVTILVGAGVGAIIGGGANVIGQLINGKKVSELDWKSIGIAAASGAVSGALAGSGIGLVGQVAANAALSGATSVVIQKTYNGNINWKQVALDSGIGGLAGAFGGKGAQAGVKQVISKVQNVGTSFMSVTKVVFKDPTAALAAKKELTKALTKQGLTSLSIVVKDNIVTIEAKGAAKNGK
jgi:RHS repeat-associated protein